MTREKAISFLKVIERFLPSDSVEKEAIHMAAKALENEKNILEAGYKNQSYDFYIGGRKFRARELAQ